MFKMSNEQTKNLIGATHQLATYVVIGLVGAVLYFVKDIHADFKAMRETVAADHTEIQVMKKSHEDLAARVTDLYNRK